MSVDDRKCAEICEAHGFVRQARFFRELSEGRCPVYVVVESEEGFDREEGPREGGGPWLVFLERWEAEHEAGRLNLKRYRQIKNSDPCCSWYRMSGEMSPIANLGDEEFLVRVGEILAFDYAFPTEDQDRLFPPWATEDQMKQVMDLCSIRFWYVCELELGQGGARG